MSFIDSIYERAKANKKRIAIPEATNETMLGAAVKAAQDGIADIVLVGDAAKIKELATAKGVDLSGVTVADNSDEAYREAIVERYMALPNIIMSRKSITKRAADPLYMALIMEAVGDVDCTFAGIEATTFEVVMAATGIIGLADGVATASCFFVCEFAEFQGEEGYLVGMSDGGVTVEPTAEQLAGIAISCCETFRALKDETARCAMLSYSTLGSGAGPSVDRVQEAVAIANQKRPDLFIDGEFQADAALLQRVAERKVKRPSEVAGRANVLVFPEIASCNIGSKMVQIFADCNTYGPLLQGFRLPVCDCSRGDTEANILKNLACSSVLAAGK